MAGRRPGHPTELSVVRPPRSLSRVPPLCRARGRGTGEAGGGGGHEHQRQRPPPSVASRHLPPLSRRKDRLQGPMRNPQHSQSSRPTSRKLIQVICDGFIFPAFTPHGRDRLTIGRGGQVGAGHVLPRGLGLTRAARVPVTDPHSEILPPARRVCLILNTSGRTRLAGPVYRGTDPGHRRRALARAIEPRCR